MTLRSPAVHFLALGALLYALQGAVASPQSAPSIETDRAAIVVDADDLARMSRDYARSFGGLPDETAYRFMIDRFVENEALYREALAMGLDRADQTVRWRLVEKMRYLGEAAEDDPDDEVFERALALGLQREDPIVKQVLIDKYRMLVRYARGNRRVGEQELREYYERNEQRFLGPRRASFSHVFFSAQRRGQHARADAEAALARLQAASITDEQAWALGDAFLPGHRVTDRTDSGIAQLFGEGFASAVFTLDEGRWVGPIESAFGQHLVFLSSRGGAQLRPFEAVRSQVARAAEHEAREQRLAAKIAELRDRYEVVIRADGVLADDVLADDDDA